MSPQESPRKPEVPDRQNRMDVDEQQESPILPLAQLARAEQAEPAPIEPATRDEMAVETPEPQIQRSEVKTPEPRASKETLNGARKDFPQVSPSTPGHLAPFDWDEFETRYEQAIAEADEKEEALLKEFQKLVEYFNVWAAASSVHDTERGIKRLQTRERYVRISEQTLSQKKKHLTEVVRAFQSALALLSQP
ncbi:hypothetical protein GQ53DRAFT_816515 [Thozetella sp. PMI_491]|nr:hypothetical protein GQ53DRAFT_816515 [Thozetella sp. PMI_491]